MLRNRGPRCLITRKRERRRGGKDRGFCLRVTVDRFRFYTRGKHLDIIILFEASLTHRFGMERGWGRGARKRHRETRFFVYGMAFRSKIIDSRSWAWKRPARFSMPLGAALSITIIRTFRSAMLVVIFARISIQLALIIHPSQPTAGFFVGWQ